ncbi:sulfatase-like hydrolase/transferase [Enterobacter sp. MGH 14]|uniref:sulfatase-like hydrolase/transferase n=1 Tax=Enterobacter sp. MGH 14 TaxID=1329823 RepID=UPI0003B55865|nr:sulfatase-like hydrolase/transferase [Enterobacter sp. MGH 14]ERO99579.1 hypothetical protein L360_05205 [Enterobacter sp. MGH 14]
MMKSPKCQVISLSPSISLAAMDRLITCVIRLSHRHFMPECARSDIENCTQEQLVNTYDNTLRYTDYVLAEMIEKLKNYSDQYNTVLLYVSDHGESLGESGLYLHGTPYKLAPDQQTHIPMQVWMSPGFIRRETHQHVLP